MNYERVFRTNDGEMELNWQRMWDAERELDEHWFDLI